jgi:uncharacterized protein YigE (DUF2233 family)
MIRIRAARLAAVIALIAASVGTATAAPCRAESFAGADYTVCSFDLTQTDMRMFWRRPDHRPYATFDGLAEELKSEGRTLRFAMNGGMYRDDLSPVGLYIENGVEMREANLADAPKGPGNVPNFYKKPNGVFYIGDDEAGVLETGLFLNVRPETNYATQSGPLLLIDGKIHPAFIVGSTDRKPRDGVCVTGTSQVHFVISGGRVNFHDFARFFRDGLGCRDALFLDGGSAPGLYAPELGRDDKPAHGGYGPIIAVVE